MILKKRGACRFLGMCAACVLFVTGSSLRAEVEVTVDLAAQSVTMAVADHTLEARLRRTTDERQRELIERFETGLWSE